jgi:hypothetical protein
MALMHMPRPQVLQRLAAYRREVSAVDKKLISGDVTLELKAGTFGGNPTLTVGCRNLPVIERTPQQLLDWIAPFIDEQAKQYDT